MNILKILQETNLDSVRVFLALMISLLVIITLSIDLYFGIDFSNLSLINTETGLIDWLTGRSEEHVAFKLVTAIVPALLAISYPFIIQTIGQLDTYYGSNNILSKFFDEELHKAFQISLIISVFLSFLMVLGHNGFVLMSFLSLTLLVTIFIFYAHLLLKYHDGKKLYKHFVQSKDLDYLKQAEVSETQITKTKKEIAKNWYALVDLYLHACRRKDQELQEEVFYGFLVPSFQFIRDKEFKRVGVYKLSKEYHRAAYEIIQEYIERDNVHSPIHVHAWLFELFAPLNFEKKQYFDVNSFWTIWRNLSLLILHKKRSIVYQYWMNAHAFSNSYFNTPKVDFDSSFEQTEGNKKQIAEHSENKKLFLNFHIQLMAVLLYTEDYELIKKNWNHTNSWPPRYLLTPNRADEIIDIYDKSDDWKILETKLRFGYEELQYSAIGGNLDVLFFVRKYSILLFIKLWKQSDGQLPRLNPPKGLAEKPTFIRLLESFTRNLKKVLKEDHMIESLDLKLNDEKRAELYLYLKDSVDDVEESISDDLVTEPLSNEKIKIFKDEAENQLVNLYKRYKLISNKISIAEEDRDQVSENMSVIRGQYSRLRREMFLKKSRTTFFEFERTLPLQISANFNGHVHVKFNLNSSKSIELDAADLFLAIDKLELNSEFSLVFFNINLTRFLEDEEVKIEESKLEEGVFIYKSINIYTYDYRFNEIGSTIYVLKQVDLPRIFMKNWEDIEDKMSEEVVEEWKSKKLLNKDYLFYHNLIDYLGEDESNIPKSYGSEKVDENGEPIVIWDIDFLAYCWFKRKTEILEIKQARMFQVGGDVVSLDEIKPFKKYFQ